MKTTQKPEKFKEVRRYITWFFYA